MSSDTLKDFLNDVRIFFYGGIRSLPLTIAGTMLILGLFTANYAMLFFLTGYLILVPIIVWIANFISNYTIVDKANSYFKFSTADTCKISIPYATKPSNMKATEAPEAIVFSPWLAMIMFFNGYLLKNAITLYNREPIANAFNVMKSDSASTAASTETGSGRRRMQSVISIICIVIFTIYVLYSRMKSASGCESPATAGITTAIFSFLGYGWYAALSAIKQDRLSDLFGIANRLLAPGAIANQPIACVQVP